MAFFACSPEDRGTGLAESEARHGVDDLWRVDDGPATVEAGIYSSAECKTAHHAGGDSQAISASKSDGGSCDDDPSIRIDV